MRVNRGRLDLKSLTLGIPCTIITGLSSISLTHVGRNVQMGIYLKGVGPMRPGDDLTSCQDEHGKGFQTYWLHLDRLSPNRLYELTVTSFGDGVWPGTKLSDRTPGKDHEYRQYRTDNRTMIDKLLGWGR